MRTIKGLERPVVVWSTRAEIDADDSLLEWIYTILTRTTGVLIVLLSVETPEEVRRILGRLREDRVLPWTAQAEQRFEELRRR
jgi:hypothetical protein